MKNLFLVLSLWLAGAVCMPLIAQGTSTNGWIFYVKPDGTARVEKPIHREHVWNDRLMGLVYPIFDRITSNLEIPATVTEELVAWNPRTLKEEVTIGGTYTVSEFVSRVTEEQRLAVTSVSFANSVTIIGTNAFENYINLKDITIPSTVTTIGIGAFAGSGLTSVTVPETVTSMGTNVFRNCTSLQSADVQNSIIPQGQFLGCTALTDLTISSNVTTIETGAFSNCTGLEVVTVPASVTSVVGSAFNGMTGLKTLNFYAKDVPVFRGFTFETLDLTGAETIADRAFERCTRLTSVTLGNSITSLGYSAFLGCTNLTAITIPGSVTEFGSIAFANCTGLTSVSILEGVTAIGSSAFEGCTGLTAITIPGSVTAIEVSAFADCTGLTSATLGSGITEIGELAFYRCSGLTSITCKATVPPAMFSRNTFLNVDKSIPVYVPCGSQAAYQAALYWRDFTNIIECAGTEATAGENSAVISWYAVPEATGYRLTVYTDAARTQVFGNYTLNTAGQPQAAPAQRGAAKAPAGEQLSYTVIGLSPETHYWYSLEALAADNASANFDGEFTTTGSTGIDDLSQNNGISIYPNPVKDELRVESGELRVESVEIVDLNGRSVETWRTSASLSNHATSLQADGRVIMNVSHLSAGIYLVKIETDKATVTKKLVKK
jgi:hypothetical protein